jgi:hypothetical protein
MTILIAQPVQTLRQWLVSLPTDARSLLWHAAAMFLACAVCLLLQVLDDRLYNGANLWLKPTKFFFSFGLHMLTVAWAITQAAQHNLNLRGVRHARNLLLVASWFELVYITYRASQGAPSHFDITSALSIALFAMMAIAAVLLVFATARIGFLVWKSNPAMLMTRAIAIGFALSAVLTVFVGLNIGENLGPWVGGVQSNAGGLPFFRWSTTGGDLRVSHFVATHIAQLVPLAAFSGRPLIVWLTTGFCLLLTIATFWQAQAGLPLIAL